MEPGPRSLPVPQGQWLILTVSSLTMSEKTSPPCYKVWDRLWYCGSPGGQFRNIYRFGEVEDCQPYWDDWMNCMKAKVYQDKDAKQVGTCIIIYLLTHSLTYSFTNSLHSLTHSLTHLLTYSLICNTTEIAG